MLERLMIDKLDQVRERKYTATVNRSVYVPSVGSLDSLGFRDLMSSPGAIYADADWGERPCRPFVEYVRRNRLLSVILRRSCRWFFLTALAQFVSDLEYAFRLLARSCKPRSVGLIGGDRAGYLFCLLRSFLHSPGKVVLFDILLHPESGLKKRLIRRALSSATICVVYSRKNVEHYCREFHQDENHFIVVPYKANHSKFPTERAFIRGDYIFSGGNSERDYRTLFQAVEGLEIAVVVSTTIPAATWGLQCPSNVILIRAEEPHFRRLMSGARLVVIPLLSGRLRGAGEASFLNAMWHGRPVICGDDVAAPEYIRDGIDGVVVRPGDPKALRLAILDLWEDRAKAEAMGEAAQARVKAAFTHDLFRERMLKLACLFCGEQSRESPRLEPLSGQGT